MRHELKLADSLDGLETALSSLLSRVQADQEVEVKAPLGRVRRKRRDVSVAERLNNAEPKDLIGE